MQFFVTIEINVSETTNSANNDIMVFNEYISNETEIFHNILRTNVTIYLIYVALFFIAFLTVSLLKVPQKHDKSSMSKNDSCIYLFAVLVCSFSLSISVAGTLLLPISIISNDVIIRYPERYYLQWIDKALIEYLWSTVTVTTNISVFFLMPFGIYFLDSCGFKFIRNDLKSRMLETMWFLFSSFILILGLSWIIFLPFRSYNSFFDSIQDLWNYNLPLLYSLFSLFGVLFVCITSPFGCVTLLMNQCMTLIDFIRRNLKNIIDDNESIYYKFELENLTNQLKNHDRRSLLYVKSDNEIQQEMIEICSKINRKTFVKVIFKELLKIGVILVPIVLLMLYVVYNIIGITVGIQALPRSNSNIEIGLFPSSKFGWIGCALQVFVIYFVLFSSIYMLCSNGFVNIKAPFYHSYHIQDLLWYAALLQVLTKSIAIQCRMLGITTFNLYGTFGNYDWLNNGRFVFFYNLLYIVIFATVFLRRFWHHKTYSPHALYCTIRQIIIDYILFSTNQNAPSVMCTFILSCLLQQPISVAGVTTTNESSSSSNPDTPNTAS